MNNKLDEKEKELNERFETKKKEAVKVEEQIKVLQTHYQEITTDLVKIQGAFALLQELKVNETLKVEPKKK